jgi:hypothetical protein
MPLTCHRLHGNTAPGPFISTPPVDSPSRSWPDCRTVRDRLEDYPTLLPGVSSDDSRAPESNFSYRMRRGDGAIIILSDGRQDASVQERFLRCLFGLNRSAFPPATDAVAFWHYLLRFGPPANFGGALGGLASYGLGWHAGQILRSRRYGSRGRQNL